MSKTRHFPPPPTRFGSTPAQPKAAPAKPATPPPPPTRFGPTAPPIQAKPAVAPFIPLAVIQPMLSGDEDEDGIGHRVTRRNKANGFKSERLKNKFGGGTNKTVPRYTPYRAKGVWNGKRPAWEDGTWLLLASNSRVNPHQYTCVDCGKTPIYRKKDRPAQARANDATIDHIQDWWNYITSHARPNADGNISPSAAKNAYNDLRNLQIMCRSCNARKNGPRNVHD